MAIVQGPIFPFNEPIAGTALVTPRWRRWLLNLRDSVNQSAQAIPVPAQVLQTASIPTTDMTQGGVSAGLYTVSWYLNIAVTEAASTARVTIGWTDDVGSKSYVASIVDGSVAGNYQADQRLTFYSVAASPITYSVAYVGATMVYNIRPVLQSVVTA